MLSGKMNQILFEAGQKFAIDYDSAKLSIGVDSAKRDGEHQEFLFAATINRKLQDYGYSLSKSDMLTLSAFPIDSQKDIANALFSCIHEHLGDELFQGTKTFYPNFPDEVMKKTEFELYMNAFLYYLGENVLGVNAHEALVEAGLADRERIPSGPLLEVFKRDLEYITFVDVSELHSLMDNRIHGTGMSREKLDELFLYKKEFPNEFKSFLFSGRRFNSRENMVNIALRLYEEGDDGKVLKQILKSANDILRFAAVLSNKRIEDKNRGFWRNRYMLNDANLSVPPEKMIIRLSGDEKRLIMKLLDKSPDLYEDLWRNKRRWKKAMPYIGMRYASDRVRDAFDNLADNRKLNERGHQFNTPMRKLELAVQALPSNDGISEIRRFAKEFPGLFIKNLVWILDSCHDNRAAEEIVSFIDAYCDTVAPMDLLKVRNVIDRREAWEWRTFPVKSGKIKLIGNEPRPCLDPKIKGEAIAVLESAIINSTFSMRDMGKVYIDPLLKYNMIPTRGERNASGGAALTFGTSIPCEKGKNLLAFGVWWKNMKDSGGEEIRADIDVSAVMYDEEGCFLDTVYYANLRNSYCIHSGDFTSGDALRDGKGVEEIVVLDKEKARAAGVRYVIMEVHGFTCDFNKAENVRAIFLEKEGNFDNEPILSGGPVKLDHLEYVEIDGDDTGGAPGNRGSEAEYGKDTHPVFLGRPVEGVEIESSIRLNAAADHELPVFLDLKEDRFIWLDRTDLIKKGLRNTMNIEGRMQSIATVIHAENNAIPDMRQLFMAHAMGRGEIVDSPGDADTVFLSKPADRGELGIKDGARVITAYDLDIISAELCAAG